MFLFVDDISIVWDSTALTFVRKYIIQMLHIWLGFGNGEREQYNF